MILVTGATGKVGTEVVRQLVEKGVPVRALARSPGKARGLLPAEVEIVAGDLRDRASLDAALAGADHLFLLPTPDADQLEMELNAIEAAKAAGVQHVVKLSAIGASEESPVLLARKHREAEKALAASGLGWTVLQPTFFMQNFLGSADTIRSQGAIYQSVNGRAPYVDVRDIAAVAVAALTEPGHQGQTYVITGGEAITYPQAAEIISRVIGKPVQYVRISPEQLRAALVGAGLPEAFADDLVTLSDVINHGWAEEVTDVVRTVAKKEPIRFEQFVRDHAAVFAGEPATALA